MVGSTGNQVYQDHSQPQIQLALKLNYRPLFFGKLCTIGNREDNSTIELGRGARKAQNPKAPLVLEKQNQSSSMVSHVFKFSGRFLPIPLECGERGTKPEGLAFPTSLSHTDSGSMGLRIQVFLPPAHSWATSSPPSPLLAHHGPRADLAWSVWVRVRPGKVQQVPLSSSAPADVWRGREEGVKGFSQSVWYILQGVHPSPKGFLFFSWQDDEKVVTSNDKNCYFLIPPPQHLCSTVNF